MLAVIQTLQPGIVLLVAGRWLGERATGWHIGWTAVGVIGVVVAILGGDPEVRGSALGVVFGVASMLTFTGYYLINRRARSTTPISPMEWMCGVTLFAGLVHHADRAGDELRRRLPPTRRRWTGCTCCSSPSSSASSATR